MMMTTTTTTTHCAFAAQLATHTDAHGAPLRLGGPTPVWVRGPVGVRQRYDLFCTSRPGIGYLIAIYAIRNHPSVGSTDAISIREILVQIAPACSAPKFLYSQVTKSSVLAEQHI